MTGYRLVNHGEAVAIGMVAAGKLAVELQMWQQEDAARQDVLIQKAGLPWQLPAGLDNQAIIDALQTDKKVKDGEVRFVLPSQIGLVKPTEPTVTVSSDIIKRVLQQMQ